MGRQRMPQGQTQEVDPLLGVSDELVLLSAVRRTSRVVLPPLFLMIMLNYVDRTNLSYAYLKPSFSEQFNLTATTFGLGSSIFYWTYTIMQPVGGLILGATKQPQVLIGGMNIAWGLLTVLFAFLKGRTQFYLLRLMLGIAESVAFPAAWYYTHRFIPNQYLTVAMGTVEFAKILSLCVSAPLALAIFQLDGLLGLHNWQWLFVIEGIPPIVLGAFIAVALPSHTSQVDTMTQEERDALLRELDEARTHHNVKLGAWETIRVLLANWKLWYISLACGICGLPHTAMYYFLPIVVQSVVASLGEGEVQPEGESEDTLTMGVSSIIWLLCGASLLLVSHASQHFRAPRAILGGLWFTSGFFFASLRWMDQLTPSVQLLVILVAMVPQYAVCGTYVSLMMMYAEGPAAALGAGTFNGVTNLVGQLGPIMLGLVFDSTGSYGVAFLIMGSVVMAAASMAFFAPKTKQESQS